MTIEHVNPVLGCLRQFTRILALLGFVASAILLLSLHLWQQADLTTLSDS